MFKINCFMGACIIEIFLRQRCSIYKYLLFFFPGQNDIGVVFQCELLGLSLKAHTELCFEGILALT